MSLRHLTENELAGFLDQDLSPEERDRVEVHLDACQACRDELVEVTRLVAQNQEAGVSSASGQEEESGGWRLPAGIAGVLVAAALATVFLVQPGGVSMDGTAPELERSVTEGLEQLAVHAPLDNAVVAREELRFVWADHGTQSYRITVTAEDGALIWSHSQADTIVVPPADIELSSEGRFYWYVDAVSGGVVARTGARSFRIEP